MTIRLRSLLPPSEPVNAYCLACKQRVRAVLRGLGEKAARVLRPDASIYEVTLYDVLPPAGQGRALHRHQGLARFLPGCNAPAAKVRG